MSDRRSPHPLVITLSHFRTTPFQRIDDQANDQQCQKDKENNFGNGCRAGSDTTKAEYASNNCYDKKCESPSKHN